MGWGTGSELMSDIIMDLKNRVPDDKLRQEIYEVLILHFENFDCDTLSDCIEDDEIFKSALEEAGYEFEDNEDFEEEHLFDE